MAKINADSHLHISVAFLVKAVIGVTMLTAAYYNIQNRMSNYDRVIADMHSEITVLQQKVATIEKQKVEAIIEENRTLMQKLNPFDRSKP
tara:strand:+ start:237 stop:506 length:270 start_codon:yes stop_codon:yes gene_type:complete